MPGKAKLQPVHTVLLVLNVLEVVLPRTRIQGRKRQQDQALSDQVHESVAFYWLSSSLQAYIAVSAVFNRHTHKGQEPAFSVCSQNSARGLPCC